MNECVVCLVPELNVTLTPEIILNTNNNNGGCIIKQIGNSCSLHLKYNIHTGMLIMQKSCKAIK